jgi:superfamily II DNA or RNA helicase
MLEKRCGPTDKVEARDYQIQIVNKILNKFRNGIKNVFVSLHQGSVKTIIALLALCNLVNKGYVNSVLVLIPEESWLING